MSRKMVSIRARDGGSINLACKTQGMKHDPIGTKIYERYRRRGFQKRFLAQCGNPYHLFLRVSFAALSVFNTVIYLEHGIRFL